MIRVLAILALIAMPLIAAAQEQEDDRGRLVRFLEDSLSDGAAREVRIEGFSGALSSSATLDRLTIADEDGVWLTLEGAQLDWTRTALLRGALEIDRLSADRLILDRFPAASGPTAESTPFALPELPVSIAIGALEVRRISLGAPILGIAAELQLGGALTLAGGEGAANLTLDRLDGPTGRFALSTSYANESAVLALDLRLDEDPGGLATRILSLPGLPSVALSVAGAGPVSEFRADISLSTDEQPRLTGQVASQVIDGRQGYAADLSGDVTALMPAEYRPFFGADSAMTLRALQRDGGGWLIDDLWLRSAAFGLRGQVATSPDGLPDLVQLLGRISDPDVPGAPVRLPVGRAQLSVHGVDIAIDFDRQVGPDWRLTAGADGVRADGFNAENVTLTVDGTFSDAGGGQVAARIDGQATGLMHVDPAIARALGATADLGANLTWQSGEVLRLTDLQFNGDTGRLAGDVSAFFHDLRADVDISARTRIADLSPFSDLAGQPLRGGLDLSAEGSIEALSGAFDLALSGTGRDLRLGTDLPPTLLSGETALRVGLRRDGGGLFLDGLSLTGQELRLSGNGRISSVESRVSAEMRLSDVGLFTDALSGPVSADARLTREGNGPWTIAATAGGPGGMEGTAGGQVGLPQGRVDLSLRGSAPLAIADPFIAPRSIRGVLGFDLALVGAPLVENLSGTVTVPGARIVAPTLGLVLEDTTAEARLGNARAQVQAAARVAAGGRVSAQGSVGLGASLPADLSLILDQVVFTDPALYETSVSSQGLALRGPLIGGAVVSGELILGQTDLRIPDPSAGVTEPIPDIAHQGASAAQTQTRARAGLLGTSGGGGIPMALDLTISAPGRIFLRGRGLDAELGGSLRLGGTSLDVIPSGRFDLIRGRLDLLGRRLTLSEGSVTLSGGFDPILRLVADSQVDDLTVRITVEGPASAPEIGFSSLPPLPEDEILARFFFGRSVANLSALQAVQMAQAIATLAGNNGGGLLGRVRDSLGLDDLDISTSDEGGTVVRAGRYISENIYSDVSVGSDGTANLSLNIDLTPSITASGRFDAQGNSSLGIFFERDY